MMKSFDKNYQMHINKSESMKIKLSNEKNYLITKETLSISIN